MRLLLATICVTLLVGCTTVRPNAGHEGVLIRKPMIFGSGGVDPTPVKTGLRYIAWTTQRGGRQHAAEPRRCGL